MARQISFARTVDDVVELAKSTIDPDGTPRCDRPWVREQLARAWCTAQLIRVNGLRNIGRVLASGEPGPEGSIMKLYGQEQEKWLHELALDTAGPTGVLDRGARDAPGGGKWLYGYLSTRASTIGGGTSEIQRNVIAERVLGMPRDDESR
jgi:alkylation response protein AidB-like acyl-CoA dehydrogenase